MKWTEIIDSILGTYTPIRNIDNSIVGGFGGIDIPYVTKAIFLIMGFYFFFKILNSTIQGLRR